ncbi:MAG: peroxiredoxin Q/BCP [Planctomycetota bacterium]|jgi:peroxiredoxin Q/BCP
MVYGISTDDVASQKAFHKAQKLNFSLLSDPNAGAAKAYDVLMDGRPYAKRVTFVIDGEGVLRTIDQAVQVGSHGKDLIELVLDERAK